ncbi:6139_t:CDS:2, partial [Gigaspora margarita]
TLVVKYEASASSSHQELVFSAQIALIINKHVIQIKKEMFLEQNAALSIYNNQKSILLNDEED